MSQNSNSIGLNDLVDYQKKTYSPYMDKVMKFLWKCAGADPQILQYSPYSDHIKNAGIGGVVLATTVMATMAMGFAMHTIFASPTGEVDDITKEAILSGNWFITIPISLIWGLIIFNLDRFIVSTVKGDGTEKITKEEFWAMLPRLVMAIIIGLTISAPLETYIFSKEINRELNQTRALTVQMKINQIETLYENDIAIAEKEKESKGQILNNLEPERVKFNAEVMKEANIVYCGARCQAKRAERTKWESEIFQPARLEFNNADSIWKVKISEKKSSVTIAKLATDKEAFGFLDQILALEMLSNPKIIAVKDPVSGKITEQEVRGSGFVAIWLVRLLFMIIEIAPVIFKFMIWKSSYDYMQDNVAQILEAKQGISLEYITDENNNLHKVKENYNARRIIEVSKRQNELEKENAIHAITLFAEKEREEIETDPGKFIKSDSAPSNLDGNEEPVVV